MKHNLKTRRDGTRSKQSKQRTRDYRQARRIKYSHPEKTQ